MSDYPNEKNLHILDGPRGDNAGRDHDHEDHDPASPEQEHRLDLAAVREKVREKSGQQDWRTAEERADDPHFAELIPRHFPRHASEWDDPLPRREFPKLIGASPPLGGL